MNAISITSEGRPGFTAESLPDHPLFHELSNRHRQILAECSMNASFREGDVVVEAGEPADCFYLVISGLIAMEIPGARDPQQVQNIGPGDILGWSWLFPPDFWQVNATTLEPTEVVFFHASRLRQECDRDREFGCELFKRMVRRNHRRQATPEISTASISAGANCGEDPFPALFRGGPAVFALKKETHNLFQHSPIQYAACSPQSLLDRARVALKCVSAAGKSLITGDHRAWCPEAAIPPGSPAERKA